MCNDKQTIKIVRGTTNSFSVVITAEATGDPYTLQAGEVIRFGVKQTPIESEYILVKEITEANEDDEYAFTLLPSDTIGMNFGEYWYDVGLQSEGSYYNIIPASPFEVAYNVTKWEA